MRCGVFYSSIIVFIGVVCLGERQRQSSLTVSALSSQSCDFQVTPFFSSISSNVVNNCLFSLLREVMPLEIAVLNVGMI